MESTWECEDQVSQHLIDAWEHSNADADMLDSVTAQAEALQNGAHPDAGLSRREMREAVPV